MAKRLKTKTGEDLTPEYLEELLEDAERGYDDSELKWVPAPGRPPLSQSGASQRLQVRVTPETGEILASLAEARDTTVSQLVREAIDRFVADAA